MTGYLRVTRGKLALLLGGLLIACAAAAWQRVDPVDFDPWAVD